MANKNFLKDVSLTQSDIDPTGLTWAQLEAKGWDLSQSWAEMDAYALFKNLEAGLWFHLENLNQSIKDIVGERIQSQIQHWAGDTQYRLPERLLKKLANSATSAGELGRSRTREAIDEIPIWASIINREEFLNSYTRSPDSGQKLIQVLLSEAGGSCPLCRESTSRSELRIQPKIPDAAQSSFWHAECWAELNVRFISQEYRLAKTALDKQAKCARAILKANEENFPPSGSDLHGLIPNSLIYENWAWGLFVNWTSSTAVNKNYWVTYFNYFKEFADQVVEYIVEERIPIEATTQRLEKHLPKVLVEKVMKEFIKHSDKTLEYFGFTEGTKKRESISSIYEYSSTDKGSSPYEQAISKELTWSEKALCATIDPASFFPEMGGTLSEAKKVCRRCVVQAECLTYAVEHGERFGVWGGLSERERARIAGNPKKLKKFLSEIAARIENKSQNLVGEAPSRNEIFKIKPTEYAEARIIGEKFRQGSSVLIDLSLVSPDIALRILDFVEGIVYGQGGEIESITDEIFLITASNTVVTSPPVSTKETKKESKNQKLSNAV